MTTQKPRKYTDDDIGSFLANPSKYNEEESRRIIEADLFGINRLRMPDFNYVVHTEERPRPTKKTSRYTEEERRRIDNEWGKLFNKSKMPDFNYVFHTEKKPKGGKKTRHRKQKIQRRRTIKSR